ncbi:ABC transporter ATP-binding protein [Candidatus Poribacteria bacterium]|nr:ABC transporter ATP-binding protein [Candidatus Poribacteria bacterium]MYG06045.1 ABC transporter ATP-binding protein [Candidatus Poribacteria bacterium]MYK25087.1 ABC transporter ATP-binding protein [Candidatus Poribacteria bacterium]
MPTQLLTVNAVTKGFVVNQPPIVKDISFSVYPGEIFALLGPSGCGKTTTLRLIAGFEKADAGTIAMEKRILASSAVHLPPESRGIGFVFQDYALFPHKNVLENVAFGLRKATKRARRERALDVLRMVGLTQLQTRMPHHLSGGEQQRVALARAIIARPKLLLLDEPFSSLDPGLRQSTREEVRTLLKAEGISAILVTHAQEEAFSFAERLGVMKDGSLEQVDTPEAVYRYPKTAYVASFIGQTNFIHAHVKNGVAQTQFGRVKVDGEAAGEVLLSIRPECLKMMVPGAWQSGAKSGRIVGQAFKGHDLTYCVEIDGQDYYVQTDYNSPFQVGDIVMLQAISAVAVTPSNPDQI